METFLSICNKLKQFDLLTFRTVYGALTIYTNGEPIWQIKQ